MEISAQYFLNSVADPDHNIVNWFGGWTEIVKCMKETIGGLVTMAPSDIPPKLLNQKGFANNSLSQVFSCLASLNFIIN